MESGSCRTRPRTKTNARARNPLGNRRARPGWTPRRGVPFFPKPVEKADFRIFRSDRVACPTKPRMMETKRPQKRAFRFQEIFAIYRVMVASQMVRFPFLSLRAGNEKRSVGEARGERVVRFLFMGQKWSRMEPPLYGIYGLDSHAPSARGSTRDENEGYTAVSSKQPYPAKRIRPLGE